MFAKDVWGNVFHARVMHEQEYSSAAFLDFPCPFDSSRRDPRDTSGTNRKEQGRQQNKKLRTWQLTHEIRGSDPVS
jgi:hypothetical protein